MTLIFRISSLNFESSLFSREAGSVGSAVGDAELDDDDDEEFVDVVVVVVVVVVVGDGEGACYKIRR